MDNYPEFRKAAAEFAGIDSDNSTIPILLQMMESARLRDKQDKSQQFLDATVLMVAKLARFMRKPSFQPGDIIFADDPIEDIHLTLLDLFMMQENLDQESEAVELLCSKFNIPDKPFVPLEYDRRTRWTLNTKYISPRQELDTENRIVFQTADELLGIVELKDGRILAPTTYWSKNLDSPLREFTVPWAKKAPLWNLDLIKKWGNESTIFLTDSLVAAHAAFREIRKQASKLEQKIHELEHRDRLEYRRFGAGDFERELEDAVCEKLKNRYLEYEFPGIYDLDFRLARFLYCTNNEFNQFPIRVQKTDSGDAHARYKFYRYLIQHRPPQKTITQCRQEMEEQYRSLDNSFDECAGEVPDGHQVFSDICELMDEYITGVSSIQFFEFKNVCPGGFNTKVGRRPDEKIRCFFRFCQSGGKLKDCRITFIAFSFRGKQSIYFSEKYPYSALRFGAYARRDHSRVKNQQGKTAIVF